MNYVQSFGLPTLFRLTVKVEAIVRLEDRLTAIYAIQEGQEMEAQISMDDVNIKLCRPWAAATLDNATQTAVVDCAKDGMLLSNLGAQEIFNK